jgi:hypothetical protein
MVLFLVTFAWACTFIGGWVGFMLALYSFNLHNPALVTLVVFLFALPLALLNFLGTRQLVRHPHRLWLR